MNRITFDASAQEFILKTFDKTTDPEGFIVERAHPIQKVLTQEGEPIKLGELAAITKGSQIFVKSDLISLIELSDKISS